MNDISCCRSNYKYFRICPLCRILKIKSSKAILNYIGSEFCSDPGRFNCNITKSICKTNSRMVMSDYYMGDSQQFRSRPGMSMQVSYSIKDGSPSRVNFDVSSPVEKESIPPSWFPGKISTCVYSARVSRKLGSHFSCQET